MGFAQCFAAKYHTPAGGKSQHTIHIEIQPQQKFVDMDVNETAIVNQQFHSTTCMPHAVIYAGGTLPWPLAQYLYSLPT